MMMLYFKGAVWCLFWHIHVHGRFGIYSTRLLFTIYEYVANSINNVTRNLNDRLWVHSTIIVKCEPALSLEFMMFHRWKHYIRVLISIVILLVNVFIIVYIM